MINYSQDMNISLDSFIIKMIRKLSSCKYFYKETVYGCIKTLRENYGYECLATDEEIYNKFVETWKNLT